ncbi:MAG: acyltransferase family protein [Anaerolineales bacterium]
MQEVFQDTIARMTENKRFILWLDLIRAISIFLVVLIHVASPIYNDWKLPFNVWFTGMVFNTLARVSVPLMFMVSGYLLLNHQENIRSFYWKRFRKVALPLLLWSVIYLLWNNHGYANFTPLNALKAMTLVILTKPAAYHLWFVTTLLQIYLFVPALRIFVRHADETHIRYLAWLWILLGPALNYIEQEFLVFKTIIDLGFFAEYIGFFYLGYVLGRIEMNPRKAWAAGLGYAALFAFTVYSAQYWSLAKDAYVDFYHYYLRLNMVLMSVCAFLLFKYAGERLQLAASERSERAAKVVRHLAAASFGVYLIHVLVLTMFNWGTFGFRLTVFSAPPLMMIPALTLAVFFVSYLATILLQRIPYLRALAPF